MASPDNDSPADAASETDEKPVVVGIGASAGGLAALKTFFEHVPEETGIAWVIVVHLSPEHESHLAELLQPSVKVPVQQVTETVPLQPDCVYVIPPGANLSAVDTHLRLSELEERRRERAPIDHFFRTLARTHDGHSVAVILTGTGSDGTLGLREVKEAAGLTIVQDPTEAEYDGMPQSAITTGMVDLVLPLVEIPGAILRVSQTTPDITVPTDGADAGAEERHLLHKVFAQVRARTGRDFTRYKPSTILRRVRRRMQLAGLEELPAYLALLRENAEEVRALADDLLITVTNFFRDAEVFETLEREVIPALFEGKTPDDGIRVWSVGCATGEEAYSLAILLLEEAARHDASPRIQVFASDLHERSLERAREGFYPGDIETDVSPERLRRFFEKQDGGYRVRKEVRELVVFAPHNLLADPPFSKIDLVACRNVLIYLQRDVQKEVVELFHYALRPDGFLALGTSETVDRSELFRVEDKKACLYRKRNVGSPEPRLPVFPLTHRRLPIRVGGGEGAVEPVAYGALHQRMVESVAPPSVLVSPDDKVVHLSEHAGRYLALPGGEITSNAFKLVREEFRIELRAALHAARERAEPVRSTPVPVRFDGAVRAVTLDVRPALEPEMEGFSLVIFDERPLEASPAARATEADEAPLLEVQTELDLARQRLQAVIEEYETSQEEMKASNEELQSANEELRSTMEELETSKEELQSMNEELQTVNQENRHKVEELAQLSGDLQNLLAATDIATLFLDRELRILRFTPRVGELFNVRPVDRGRPLTDITHRLGYDEIEADARLVLSKLVPVEREVEDEDGQWYLARTLPYRSTEDRIEGAVVTFVEITARKRAEEEVRQAKEYAERIIDTLHEPLLVLTPDLRVRSANPAFYEHFQVAEGETEGRLVYNLGNGQWDIPELRRLLEDVLPRNHTFDDYEVTHEFEHLGRRVMLLNARRLDDVQLILLGLRDITERKRAEEAVWESEERQSFLLSLSDTLRPIADAAAIEGESCRLLGEHLNAARAYYVEIREPEGAAVVQQDYAREGLPSLAREYPLSEWAWVIPLYKQGRPVVVEDVWASGQIPDPDRERAAAAHVAWIAVPLVKDEDLVGALCVAEAEPRSWTAQEVGLVGQTAERVWMAVERARVEKALRESEERFRAFVNASSDVVYRMGPDWVEMRQLEGRGFLVDTARPTASWWDTYIDPADRPAVEAAIQEAIRTQAPFEFEHRVRRTDGTLGWTLSRAVPILSDDGEIVEWFGAASDITEQKEIADALRESEERYRTLFESIDEGFCVVEVLFDDDGAPEDYRFIDVNPAFEKQTGLSDAMGKRMKTLAPGHEAHWFEVYGRIARTGRPERFTAEAQSLDDRWYDVYAFRIGSPEERRVAILFTDVAEQRRAEAAVRESEARFRTLAETVPDAVFTAAPDGTVDYVNRQHAALTGVASEQVLGTVMWPDLVHPDDRAAAEAAWAEACEREERFEVRYRLRNVNEGADAYCWVIVRARPVFDEDGTLTRWFGTITDVDALARAEEAVRELNATLEDRVEERTREVREMAAQLTTAEQAERERIAQVLHDDLQQQLVALSMALELLRRSQSDPDPLFDQADEILGSAIDVARTLATELSPAVLASTRIDDLLQWLAFRKEEQHGMRIDVEGGGACEIRSRPVRVLLYQALQELLFNVVKHAGTKRARLRAWEDDDDLVVVQVEDEGDGFVPDEEGTASGGFGLSSVRSRVERVGGWVRVESAPGEGTRVTLAVPIAAPEPEAD